MQRKSWCAVRGWWFAAIAAAGLLTSGGSAVAEDVAPPKELRISRSEYRERLAGFWLGETIANWTGLVTENKRATAPFFTDDDWGGFATWKHGDPTDGAPRIELVLITGDRPWGADDDTDIEYIYQYLTEHSPELVLTPQQIREGWLRHIYSNDDAPPLPGSNNRENFLWVSNESAYDLMRLRNLSPPATSEPANNPNFDQIDAQLTTEIFGLFAPGRPDVALQLAHLPVRTTAKDDAEWIAKFYVVMHSQIAASDPRLPLGERLRAAAEVARGQLPPGSYSADMYDFVKASYEANADKDNWEQTRDAIYKRYQLSAGAGYKYRNPWDAGINFASSLVSLFYGNGDYVRTIQIGALSGWDSDNPTATWGGLIGFAIGPQGIAKAVGNNQLSQTYWIHRTRRGFPDHTPDRDGEDSFAQMADRGVQIVDRVVVELAGGTVDTAADQWRVPVAPSATP